MQWGNLRPFLILALVTGSSYLQARVIRAPQVEFRQFYTLGPHGRIVIQNLYGDVSITGWDREDVLVEAIKRAPSRRGLDDARVVVEPSDGSLSIHTLYAGNEVGRPASVEYRIVVPRSATLDDVKLVNGGLSIDGVTGPVKATAVNGAIHAQRLAGRAELSTVNGPLEADFAEVSRARPISLSSVNGPIRLSIPCGAAVSLSAHNRSGGIDSQVGQVSREQDGQRLHTQLNRGGAQIRLENVNGGISIKQL
jgi:DUF4097 and DUF4098 domain-containing protein YvlB